MKASPTRVALVTPAGRGAVASLVVAGPEAVPLVESLFRSVGGHRLSEQPTDRIFFGVWLTTGEDVVVARRDGSRVEIHCHGGAAASEAILAALADAGCQRVSWQELVAADEPNAIRAAARIALAACATQRSASILLDQYNGALAASISRVMQHLEQGDDTAAVSQLRDLLAWAPFGQHLTEPWRVAIAGPPNVGKSTLINALVGYQRAIVFDQPGTTRDVVTASTAVDGWPVELADTAGLRAGGQPLEQIGVARAEAELRAADLAVLVFDVTKSWTGEAQLLTREHAVAIIVHNKADLLPSGAAAAAVLADRPAGILASAKTGWNVPALLDSMVKRLVPHVPSPGAAVPFTGEQAEAIRLAITQAERGERDRAAATLARLVAPPRRE